MRAIAYIALLISIIIVTLILWSVFAEIVNHL